MYRRYEAKDHRKVSLAHPDIRGNGPNSLPNDNFLDWSKFKAFADDNISASERLELL